MKPGQGNSRSTQGTGHLFCWAGSAPYPEAQNLTGTSRHYTTPLLNLHCKGLLRLYQKTSPKAQELLRLMRTTGLRKICTNWPLHRKKQLRYWQLKSERSKRRVTADQWEMQARKKRGQREEKIVLPLVLKLKIVNYKYYLNLNYISTLTWNYNKKWLHCWIFLKNNYSLNKRHFLSLIPNVITYSELPVVFAKHGKYSGLAHN